VRKRELARVRARAREREGDREKQEAEREGESKEKTEKTVNACVCTRGDSDAGASVLMDIIHYLNTQPQLVVSPRRHFCNGMSVYACTSSIHVMHIRIYIRIYIYMYMCVCAFAHLLANLQKMMIS